MTCGRIGTTRFLHIHQLQLHITTSLNLTMTVMITQLQGPPHHRGDQYNLSTLACLVNCHPSNASCNDSQSLQSGNPIAMDWATIDIKEHCFSVVHPIIKQMITQYKKLQHDPHIKDLRVPAFSKEVHHLAQGKPGVNKATNTIFFLSHNEIQYIPNNRTITYACSKPVGPKPEIQHNQRGRGVPTLTREEVTLREGKRRCCSCTKKTIMSLRLKVKVIFSLQARSMYHVGFYTIAYIRVHIQSWHIANTRK
jgi:hypothetical protein